MLKRKTILKIYAQKKCATLYQNRALSYYKNMTWQKNTKDYFNILQTFTNTTWLIPSLCPV